MLPLIPANVSDHMDDHLSESQLGNDHVVTGLALRDAAVPVRNSRIRNCNLF
jgi:hypothetical protein